MRLCCDPLPLPCSWYTPYEGTRWRLNSSRAVSEAGATWLSWLGILEVVSQVLHFLFYNIKAMQQTHSRESGFDKLNRAFTLPNRRDQVIEVLQKGLKLRALHVIQYAWIVWYCIGFQKLATVGKLDGCQDVYGWMMVVLVCGSIDLASMVAILCHPGLREMIKAVFES